MDSLFEPLILAIRLWREVLGAVAGALVALLLAGLFPSFPAAASFSLGFAGASVGVVWHIAVASAQDAASGRKAEPISAPVSFLAIALVGGLWGGLLASFAGPAWAALALLVAPCLLGPLFGRIAKRRVSPNAIAFATLASLIGLAVLHGIRFALGA